ncbi:MAG: anhydro-N-acetylmuramic acid kinase [Anaerolineae bacterium]
MKVIGLMSGTSADGVDVALCEITGEPPSLEAHIIEAIVKPYPLAFQQRILEACLPEKGSVDVLCVLNVELADVFAEAALEIIAKAGLHPSDVDLIGSHGQTVWHNVLPDGRVNATLQLVEGAVLAEKTQITTINNFRARDVAAGGQGAPLTGYVDWLLLRHPTRWRAVQNIGGMGNVTFLPPLTDATTEPVTFDTGPGNALIDGVVYMLSGGEKAYDANGALARQGRVDEVWLDELMQHPYYARGIPKTTGREVFGTQMARELVTTGRQRGLPDSDILMSVTMLTATTIAEAYNRFAPSRIEEVILGGGGRHNALLVEILQGLLAPVTVLTHEDIGLNSDYKEALVFAVLAYETWHARPGTQPALTGVNQPVVLGQITPGANYVNLIQQTWCKP